MHPGPIDYPPPLANISFVVIVVVGGGGGGGGRGGDKAKICKD